MDISCVIKQLKPPTRSSFSGICENVVLVSPWIKDQFLCGSSLIVMKFGKNAELVTHFKPNGLRANLTVLRWLLDTNQIIVDEVLKDNLAELERIQALFNKLKEPEPRIESYYQKLQRRCDEGKTSIKSVRLALQPAIDLISVNNITDYPTQDQLNQYLVEKSEQTAAITSFINHLRNTIESLKSIISGFSKLRLNSLKNIVLSA